MLAAIMAVAAFHSQGNQVRFIPGHLLIARSARNKNRPRPESGHQVSSAARLLFGSGVKRRLSPSSMLSGSSTSPPLSSASLFSRAVLGLISRYSLG